MSDDLYFTAGQSQFQAVYGDPDRIKKESGYRPTNCGEQRDVISTLDLRDAYRRAAAHINEDPHNNCCSIEVDSEFKLYLWKAAELPVMLTKDKSNTTFLCFKELKYLKYPVSSERDLSCSVC